MISVTEIKWELGNCYGSVSSSSDPDPHFPERGEPAAEAKRICDGCPIKDDCRQYAVEHKIEHGVWGGLTASELRKLNKDFTVKRRCVLCRDPFEPYSSNDKYCSDDCSAEASNRRARSRRQGALPTHIIDRRTA